MSRSVKKNFIATPVVITNTSSVPDYFNQDEWRVELLGFKRNIASSIYSINFKALLPAWFKIAVKHFTRFNAASKSLSTCRTYITGLAHFGRFILIRHIEDANAINRELLLEFTHYLAQQSLKPASRISALVSFRCFHIACVQNGWLMLTPEPLVYESDFPKPEAAMPRFIPESVLAQLQTKLHHLPDYLARLITVLLETGRRISEICTLPYECLETDSDGDYYLRVHDQKLSKHYLLPLSQSAITAIKNQQSFVKPADEIPIPPYLFLSSQKRRQHLCVSARHVNTALNQLAHDQKINDDNGVIWQFSTHQFRHTVGTRMINAEVPQIIVQKYLGHESAEMTARYAHIHQATLKEAFEKFQGTLVTVQGKAIETPLLQDGKWLKHNVLSQSLPNGLCALPAAQQRCPHANACLTCTHFRTNRTFLPEHKAQLTRTKQLITSAKQNSATRIVEMNQRVATNLQTIIHTLEETPHDNS